MGRLIEHRRDGSVFIFAMNMPQRRNAISIEMREELAAELGAACASDDCRAIVLTGAGEHFSAGGDVKSANGAAAAPDPGRTQRNVGVLHDIVRALIAGPKATVAAVEGSAYGAGLSLAAACDHVVASATARFCASFGKVGLIADAGLMWSLPQRIGTARAREMLLSCRVVEAVEAEAMGLANQRVEAGAALQHAIAAAHRLAATAPLTVAATKAMLARGPAPLEDVLAAEQDVQPRLTLSQDYAEGKAAFKERRAPVFRGL